MEWDDELPLMEMELVATRCTLDLVKNSCLAMRKGTDKTRVKTTGLT